MSVLKSRKFWFTLISLSAILCGLFLPEVGARFEANADAIAGAVTILAVYVISMAMDPGAGWAGLLRSRKFWTLLVGLTVMVMDVFKIALPYGMTGEQIATICVAIGGYMVAVAIEGKVIPQLSTNKAEK